MDTNLYIKREDLSMMNFAKSKQMILKWGFLLREWGFSKKNLIIWNFFFGMNLIEEWVTQPFNLPTLEPLNACSTILTLWFGLNSSRLGKILGEGFFSNIRDFLRRIWNLICHWTSQRYQFSWFLGQDPENTRCFLLP